MNTGGGSFIMVTYIYIYSSNSSAGWWLKYISEFQPAYYKWLSGPTVILYWTEASSFAIISCKKLEIDLISLLISLSVFTFVLKIARKNNKEVRKRSTIIPELTFSDIKISNLDNNDIATPCVLFPSNKNTSPGMSESQISLSASNGNLVPKKGSYFNVLQQSWILYKMCNKYVLSGSGNNKPWGKNKKKTLSTTSLKRHVSRC